MTGRHHAFGRLTASIAGKRMEKMAASNPSSSERMPVFLRLSPKEALMTPAKPLPDPAMARAMQDAGAGGAVSAQAAG
jgi:hypothetical protein